MEFEIRRAENRDAVKIRNLHVDSIRKICAADYDSEQINAWASFRPAQNYRDAINIHGETMFVAESGNRVVGFSSCRESEVCAVYVRPGFTKFGVGAALLRAVEKQLKVNGIKTAHLSSSKTAYSFYSRHGWQNMGEKHHELRNGIKIPCIAMEKML